MNTEKPSSLSEVGDIIKDLNLPKQILDKATELAKTLFGPAANEVGEMFADKVRHRRMKNQVVIFNKTVDLLEKNNLKARGLDMKTLVPLLEQSSLEEDELLQDKWANLIANIASTPASGLEPKLIKTLSSLSALEAQVFDFAFNQFTSERQKLYDDSQKRKYNVYKTLEEVRLDSVVLDFDEVKKEFGLTQEFAKICVDNLTALGLLRYDDPQIDIEDSGSEVHDEDDPDRGKAYNLELSVYATYSQSDDFTLTVYGRYFYNQCNNAPTGKKKA